MAMHELELASRKHGAWLGLVYADISHSLCSHIGTHCLFPDVRERQDSQRGARYRRQNP